MSYAKNQHGDSTQYMPSGGHAKRLPAGMYSIQNTMMGPVVTTIVPNTDQLLDIPGTAADEVMRDVREFQSKRADYERYGFTHKRGYLMYGPPGTGKTCIAQLIAKRFVDDDGLVFMIEPTHLPMAVEFVRANEPKRNMMVLMEDPDEYELNTSNVLAYLDGTKAVSGLVSVVTTNYKSKMPPRLANRPGRFDRVVLVDRINPAIQLAFLEQLEQRDTSGPRVAPQLVEAMAGLPLTLAHLKEAFCAHVILGSPIPDVRRRFEAMASTVNTDDGEPTDSDDEDEDDSPFGE